MTQNLNSFQSNLFVLSTAALNHQTHGSLRANFQGTRFIRALSLKGLITSFFFWMFDSFFGTQTQLKAFRNAALKTAEAFSHFTERAEECKQRLLSHVGDANHITDREDKNYLFEFLQVAKPLCKLCKNETFSINLIAIFESTLGLERRQSERLIGSWFRLIEETKFLRLAVSTQVEVPYRSLKEVMSEPLSDRLNSRVIRWCNELVRFDPSRTNDSKEVFQRKRALKIAKFARPLYDAISTNIQPSFSITYKEFIIKLKLHGLYEKFPIDFDLTPYIAPMRRLYDQEDEEVVRSKSISEYFIEERYHDNISDFPMLEMPYIETGGRFCVKEKAKTLAELFKSDEPRALKALYNLTNQENFYIDSESRFIPNNFYVTEKNLIKVSRPHIKIYPHLELYDRFLLDLANGDERRYIALLHKVIPTKIHSYLYLAKKRVYGDHTMNNSYMSYLCRESVHCAVELKGRFDYFFEDLGNMFKIPKKDLEAAIKIYWPTYAEKFPSLEITEDSVYELQENILRLTNKESEWIRS